MSGAELEITVIGDGAADPSRADPSRADSPQADSPWAGDPTVGDAPDRYDFEAFYADHFVALTTQLYAYFGDRQEAQDVVQEAFCRALVRWRVISRYAEPEAWVRRVAWNLATSGVRRSRVASAFRRRYRAEPVEPPNPDRVVLVAALRALPERQRQALVLHYLADLPITEIAALMHVSLGTVKSWLHRGRTALAGQLAPSDPAAGAIEEAHHD